jgi:tRNA G37 N-methylase Trm5
VVEKVGNLPRDGICVPHPSRDKADSHRIPSLPKDTIDHILINMPTTIHGFLPPDHLASPISLGIHVIHYLLLAPLFKAADEPRSVLRSANARTGRWDRFEDEAVKSTGLGGGWTVSCS